MYNPTCPGCNVKFDSPHAHICYQDDSHGFYRLGKHGERLPIIVCDACYTAHLKAVYPHAVKIITHFENQLATFQNITGIQARQLPEINPPILAETLKDSEHETI